LRVHRAIFSFRAASEILKAVQSLGPEAIEALQVAMRE
jgi:hypothetical protein